MFVVRVIPLTPSILLEPLSYRSTSLTPRGAIVTVSLRKKKVQALVVACIPAREVKSVLKRASFILSESVGPIEGYLEEGVLCAYEKIAAYHAVPLTSVVSVLAEISCVTISDKRMKKKDASRISYVEDDFHTRIVRYREIIEKVLEDGASALLCVPTLAEVAFWKKTYSDLHPVVYGASKEQKEKNESRCAKVSITGLFITTPAHVVRYVPHKRLVLLERVGSGSYRRIKRPHLDMRVVATCMSEAEGTSLVYGDYPLPLEYGESSVRDDTHKIKFSAIEVIDVRRDTLLNQNDDTSGGFTVFAPKVVKKIKKTLEAGGRVAVVAVRKGYSATVVCRDCGTALVDKHGAPFSFSIRGGKRIFVSRNGEFLDAKNVMCPVCESWNLLPLGVGVERVLEEVSLLFPDIECVWVDPESKSLVKKKELKKALERQSVIVVGTEGMIPWLLSDRIPLVALAIVASADSLLSVPFWRARERFLRLVYLLSSCAMETIVQTRKPDDTAVQALASGDISFFINEESGLRKALGFSPHGTLISFTFAGSSWRLEEIEEIIRNVFVDYALLEAPYRSFKKNVYTKTLVLLCAEGVWPDEEILSKILVLPPEVLVAINSESMG